MPTNYRIERAELNCCIRVSGALTAILVPELKEAISRELNQQTRELVFDLRETTMLDSSGIGLLIATSNSLARKNASLRVIEPPPEIFELLQHMRLVDRLNVHPSTIVR